MDAAQDSPVPVTPWPAGEGPALLVGGTFDPPHEAHARLAALARDRGMGDDAWLVFVPAARSPHKDAGPTVSDADRVRMLEIAIDGLERAVVWTDEIDRARDGAASYWIDTLRRAREASGGAPLRFLIGADQAIAFHRWREFREILALAEPVVLPRGEVASPDALADRLRRAGVWTHDEVAAWRGWMADAPIMDVSATEIRRALADPERRPRPIEGLGDRVRAHIEREGLYRGA